MSDIKQREINWQDLELQSVKKNYGFLFKLILAVSFVALFSLAMNTLLNYMHFTKIYENLIKETFYTQAENVAANLEAGLKLGISLPNLANSKNLLKQARKQNSDILFLTLEANKKIIHHVGGAGRCKPDVNAHYKVVRYKIYNSFGQVAGQLCLGYDAASIQQQEAVVRDDLLNKTGLLFLVVVGMLTFVLSILTHRTRKELSTLYQLIQKVERFTEGQSPSSISEGYCYNENQELEIEIERSQLNLPVKAFCEKVNEIVSSIDEQPTELPGTPTIVDRRQ